MMGCIAEVMKYRGYLLVVVSRFRFATGVMTPASIDGQSGVGFRPKCRLLFGPASAGARFVEFVTSTG